MVRLPNNRISTIIFSSSVAIALPSNSMKLLIILSKMPTKHQTRDAGSETKSSNLNKASLQNCLNPAEDKQTNKKYQLTVKEKDLCLNTFLPIYKRRRRRKTDRRRKKRGRRKKVAGTAARENMSDNVEQMDTEQQLAGAPTKPGTVGGGGGIGRSTGNYNTTEWKYEGDFVKITYIVPGILS